MSVTINVYDQQTKTWRMFTKLSELGKVLKKVREQTPSDRDPAGIKSMTRGDLARIINFQIAYRSLGEPFIDEQCIVSIENKKQIKFDVHYLRVKQICRALELKLAVNS